MEIAEIIPHIEALIFASDKPLTSMELTELINNAFGFMEEKLTLEQVQTSVDGIIEKYASSFYPFEIRESGGGWQFLTKKEFHKTVGQLNGEKFLKRLSSAALETLAIIAYKQPITKGEIESIRGVSSDYSIQKLLEKELIIIAGRNENMPGKPLIYTVSKTFMDYFGLNSTADLPKLKEIFADTMAEATQISSLTGEKDDSEIESGEQNSAPGEGKQNSDEATDAESGILTVSGNGELVETEEKDKTQDLSEESDETETADLEIADEEEADREIATGDLNKEDNESAGEEELKEDEDGLEEEEEDEDHGDETDEENDDLNNRGNSNGGNDDDDDDDSGKKPGKKR